MEQTQRRQTSAIDAAIGAQIMAARTSRAVTQRGLAKAIDVSFQQLQKYECGMNRVSVATFIRIAKALEVPPADLLNTIVEMVDQEHSSPDQMAGLDGFIKR